MIPQLVRSGLKSNLFLCEVSLPVHHTYSSQQLCEWVLFMVFTLQSRNLKLGEVEALSSAQSKKESVQWEWTQVWLFSTLNLPYRVGPTIDRAYLIRPPYLQIVYKKACFLSQVCPAVALILVGGAQEYLLFAINGWLARLLRKKNI
jgi:hypothetical protein